MTIENIQEKIKSIQEKMDKWSPEEISQNLERNEILTQTDDHFASLEADLATLLEHCKMLPVSDQDSLTPYLKGLKDFVQEKFENTEKELIEIKSKMNTGRTHAQAIKAYKSYDKSFSD